MKITDYRIVNAQTRSDLVREVKAGIYDGWEILGVPQRGSDPEFWWQAMVKRFDPHEGKVWVKLEGKRGQWMDPESAAIARQTSS
jgi:hypothetical protein